MAAATIDFKKKPADLSTFKEALEKAPKNILAKSILEASKKDGHVAKIFWDALVATETGNKKGAKARFETCRHCKEGFDVTNNTDKSCVWHHGNLIIDEEVWNEYSEIDEGPTDSKENRRERPQGFFWDCCGLQLNSEGCLSTKHAAAAVLKRNSKILPELQPERKAQYADSIDEPHDATEPPSKKRKVDADVTIKCRKCGEMYNELKNKKKLCHWHDAVRRRTGTREGWDSDEEEDVYESDAWGGDEGDSDGDGEDGETIQWTCCGRKKNAEGCVVTPHLPPRMTRPKVPGKDKHHP